MLIDTLLKDSRTNTAATPDLIAAAATVAVQKGVLPQIGLIWSACNPAGTSMQGDLRLVRTPVAEVSQR